MKNKINKIISGIILSIVATAIWEKIISPYFDKLLNYLLSFGNIFIVHLSDHIYSRIAQGVYINITYYIFIIVMSFLLGICIVNILIVYFNEKYNKQNVDVIEEEKTDRKNKLEPIMSKTIKSYKFKIGIFSFYTIFIVLFYLIFLLTTNFINNSITRVTNNIEILSPYIDDHGYKMLKSKFYSMTSRKDYDNLMLMINEYGNEYNVTLK